MAAKRISNRDARQHVKELEAFQGSNIYAQWHHSSNDETGNQDWYVVYSYGDHWPMFIYAEGCWFENEEKTSVTTSKHHTQCHPHRSTVPLSLNWMKRLAQGGYPAIAKERILGEAV